MEVNRDVDGATVQKAAKPVRANFVEEDGGALINRIPEASK